MNNYSEQLINSIQLITDKAIQQLKFDKTIQAEVLEILDISIGKYKIKYNGNEFSAFANDLTYVYEIGDNVFVKIPEGDFSNKKFIENKVANKTSNYSTSSTIIADIGEPITLMNEQLEVASQTTSAVASKDLTQAEETQLLQYQTFYKNFRITALLSTDFDYTPEKGEYGIRVYVNGDDNQHFDLTWRNAANLNPYINFTDGEFSAVFHIANGATINAIHKIDLFCNNFVNEDVENAKKDISCSSVILQFVDVIDLTDTPYYLQVSAPGNNQLRGNFYVNGQLLDDTTWSPQWYVQDLSEVVGDELSGSGWRKIEEANTNTYSYDTDTFDISYKLIGTYQDVVRTATITVPGKNKDLYLSQNANKLRLLGGDISEVNSCSWYFAPNGGYALFATTNEAPYEIDISGLAIYSSLVIYCDVKDKNGKSIAYLSSDYTSVDTENITVSFLGDTTVKYNANGIFTAEESSRVRRLRAQIDWGSQAPLAEGTYKLEWIAPDGTNLSNGSIARDISDSMLRNLQQTADNMLFYSVQRNCDTLSRDNNIVMLRLVTSDKTYVFKKEINFVRDGDQGTNGTQYSAAIVYCDKDGNELTDFQYLKADGKTAQYVKVIVFENGAVIDTSENWSFSWSYMNLDGLANAAEIAGPISITADKDTLGKPHYVKCHVSSDNINIYPSLPIDVSEDFNNEGFTWGNIPLYVQYASSGLNPIYTNEQLYYCRFEDSKLIVNYIPTASPSLIETVYPSSVNIITTKNNILYLKMPASIDTLKQEMPVIKAVIDGKIIYHTVYCYINTFGNEAINGWDGTVDLATENGYILAPMIGAGSKDSENKFTGVIMGKIQEKTDNKNTIKHGLYGYKDGGLTFALNAEDGSAYFKGKINADGGYIGGITIANNGLCAKDDKDEIIWSILSTGDVKFTQGTFTGNIIASTLQADYGTIGCWQIGKYYGGYGYLQSSDGLTILDSLGNFSGLGWSIKCNGEASFSNIANATITNCTIGVGADSSWTINIADANGLAVIYDWKGWGYYTQNGKEYRFPIFQSQ